MNLPSNRNLLCVPIVGPDSKAIAQQMCSAKKSADLVEWRLDLFSSMELRYLKSVCAEINLPILLTVQPGKLETDIERLLPQIVELEQICGIDLPWQQKGWLQEQGINISYKEIWHIYSLHLWDVTPEDLATCFSKMLHASGQSIIKIATYANSSLDAMRMLLVVKSLSQTHKVIGVCMSERGQISRILSPCVGNAFTFASLDPEHQSAPGQLSTQQLLETYRYRTLDAHTALYGLIGNPVDKSRSYTTHNAIFELLQRNSVYVKMAVQAEELCSFFALMRQFPFAGLSVTMPLKQAVLPYLNKVELQAQKIGAINTIKWQQGELWGYNTDGIGALNAIEQKQKVAGKKIVLIGSGGTAKAIAHEATARGARVSICSRNALAAEQIAQSLAEVKYYPREALPYILLESDICIHATPVGMTPNIDECLINKEWLLPSLLVMDVVSHPRMTKLLHHAQAQGCTTIDGIEMFIEQAAEQFAIWLEERCDRSLVRRALRKQLKK